MFPSILHSTSRICRLSITRYGLSSSFSRPIWASLPRARPPPSFPFRAFATHRDQLPKSSPPSSPPLPNSSSASSNSKVPLKETVRENIYTLPNLLTVSRILACPVLGWSIVDGNFELASGLLVYAGLTDLADGYLARRFKMRSVLGTILDPAADKALMTTLTITLAWKSMLPMPLAAIILGRDVLLSLSAFWIRYTSLPHPKTFSRYWDFSIPSAEVRPTDISKVNTALQLLLMGVTTISPLIPADLSIALQALQWIVATTTIWSGLSYVFSKNAVKVLSEQREKAVKAVKVLKDKTEQRRSARQNRRRP